MIVERACVKLRLFESTLKALWLLPCSRTADLSGRQTKAAKDSANGPPAHPQYCSEMPERCCVLAIRVQRKRMPAFPLTEFGSRINILPAPVRRSPLTGVKTFLAKGSKVPRLAALASWFRLFAIRDCPSIANTWTPKETIAGLLVLATTVIFDKHSGILSG